MQTFAKKLMFESKKYLKGKILFTVMDILEQLPKELHWNVFRFYAQHPCANLIHEQLVSQFEFHCKLYDYVKRYPKTPKQTLFDKSRHLFAMNYFVKRNGESWISET